MARTVEITLNVLLSPNYTSTKIWPKLDYPKKARELEMSEKFRKSVMSEKIRNLKYQK